MTKPTIRVSLALFTADRGITPAEAAVAVEERGFFGLYLPEHTHIPVSRDTPHPSTGDSSLPDDRYRRTLDPWVGLGTACSVTSRLRLGTSVALPLEHDPITLAKTIATVDHLSGGRVRFGVGFGWNLEEMADHGVPVKRRRTMLAEYLAAMSVLWRDDEAEFSGEFVNFGPSWAWPKPVQRPRPPILVGTNSTAKNFDWIAKHADGWISTPRDATFAESITLLRERWAAAERHGQPQVAIIDVTGGGQAATIAESGADEIVVGLPDVDRDTALKLLDTITARLADSVTFATD